jgi:hypothetical protein
MAASAFEMGLGSSKRGAGEYKLVAIGFGILVPPMVFGFARVGGPMVLAHR